MKPHRLDLISLFWFGGLVEGGYKCPDEVPVPLNFRKIGDQFIWATKSKNWESKIEAENTCIDAGGHQLINLKHFQREHFDQLSALMLLTRETQFLVGIRALNEKKPCEGTACNTELVHADGSPLDIDALSFEIFVGAQNECFTLAQENPVIKSIDCGTLDFGVLCEFVCSSGDWTLESETCGNEVVPAEYTKVGNKFYQLMARSNLDWVDAMKECSQNGSNLPMPKTKEDVDALTNITKLLMDEKVFVGLQGRFFVNCEDENCVGMLYWNSAERFTNYEDFHSVQFISTKDVAGPILDSQRQLRAIETRYELTDIICEFPCFNRTTDTHTTNTKTTTSTTYIKTTTITQSTKKTTTKTTLSRNYREWIEVGRNGVEGCQKICQKSCLSGINLCSGIKQDSIANTNQLEIVCLCRMTSIRRFPGQICGPQMTGCQRKFDPENPIAKPPNGIWVDGLNN